MRSDPAPTVSRHEVLQALPDLLVGLGIPKADKQATLQLAKNLSGSIHSMSQLAGLLTQVALGAEMSREGHETVPQLNQYLTMSRALQQE